MPKTTDITKFRTKAEAVRKGIEAAGKEFSELMELAAAMKVVPDDGITALMELTPVSGALADVPLTTSSEPPKPRTRKNKKDQPPDQVPDQEPDQTPDQVPDQEPDQTPETTE